MPAGDAGQGRASSRQRQEWLRSSRRGTYWVRTTAPPGTSAGVAAGGLRLLGGDRAGQPAVPAARTLPSATSPTICAPLLAGRVDADLGAARDQVGGHALERRPVAGERLGRPGLPGVHRLDVQPPDVPGRAAVHPRRAGGGGEEGQRRCSGPAPSRTARSRPWSSSPSQVAVGRRAALRPGGDLVEQLPGVGGVQVQLRARLRRPPRRRTPTPRSAARRRHGFARVDRPPLTPTTANARSRGQRRRRTAGRRRRSRPAWARRRPMPGTATAAIDHRRATTTTERRTMPHRRRTYTRSRGPGGGRRERRLVRRSPLRSPGRPGTSRGCARP